MASFRNRSLTLALLAAFEAISFASATAAPETTQEGGTLTAPLPGHGVESRDAQKHFRGVFFNPLVKPDVPHFSWLSFYPEYRTRVQTELADLVNATSLNLVDVFVCIPYSLKKPSQAPQEGQPLTEWANTVYLDNVAAFVDDCHSAGVSVELDLACNMWIPYSVDPTHQIANSGYWPMPDETPWNESATWYRRVIEYVEEHAKHPETIAMWSMMGNNEWGAAEPCLWEREDNPAVISNTERFVKEVWPVFRSAGKRPKATPFMLPIFSTNAYWKDRRPQARLSAFSNLKKWLCDDLALPPDYWIMSTYPFCDPAPDGFSYLKAIVEILGRENASRLISTDLKGPGHEDELQDSIISTQGHTGAEILEWHFQKCAQYGFVGWWIWAYQDMPLARSGIRDAAGTWKEELVGVIKQQADLKSER